MESYKNVLSNKFMRDTNYIIIKDTEDIDELERMFNTFSMQLTTEQQKQCDERSMQIWGMSNEDHYHALKGKLAGYPQESIIIKEDTEVKDDNKLIIQDPQDLVSTKIPIDNHATEMEIIRSLQNIEKDNLADQYEIDTNINIIGRVDGKTIDEYLDNLDRSFSNFNNQSNKLNLKSDDECRLLYGMSNLERYNSLRAKALAKENIEAIERISSTNEKTLKKDTIYQLEFVQAVYDNMKAINEDEKLKGDQHRRFNDTPYFTPTELIDMGVHGNDNFYCRPADNDGLIKSNVKVITWFDAYKDMCMNHISEDYTKQWIDTLQMLFSDFDEIKASGDEDKILARKQSILDLGWNPEVPFTKENRAKASERFSDLIDSDAVYDMFINLNDVIVDNDITTDNMDNRYIKEQATKRTHKPVFLIFTQGKTPVVSQGIKFFTGSQYSHASIAFDPTLNTVYSYNLTNGNGFLRENRKSFKDNHINIMCFFAPNHTVSKLKDTVSDFEHNKSKFDLGIFFNKILHIDYKMDKNKYHQVCSTFVDTVLRSGDIQLTDKNIPDPGQLLNGAKSRPNTIIEVYDGPAPSYNGDLVKRKLDQLLKSGIQGIDESTMLYEVKKFPVEFDKEGNLIIYKCKTGNIDYDDEIHDSVQLLQSYRNSSNIEGMKYELAKIWFINDCIEKSLTKKNLSSTKYKKLISSRATCINIFKTNLEYVLKYEKGFNFSSYYNNTPFSDNSIKITADTIKYTMKVVLGTI